MPSGLVPTTLEDRLDDIWQSNRIVNFAAHLSGTGGGARQGSHFFRHGQGRFKLEICNLPV